MLVLVVVIVFPPSSRTGDRSSEALSLRVARRFPPRALDRVRVTHWSDHRCALPGGRCRPGGERKEEAVGRAEADADLGVEDQACRPRFRRLDPPPRAPVAGKTAGSDRPEAY